MSPHLEDFLKALLAALIVVGAASAAILGWFGNALDGILLR